MVGYVKSVFNLLSFLLAGRTHPNDGVLSLCIYRAIVIIVLLCLTPVLIGPSSCVCSYASCKVELVVAALSGPVKLSTIITSTSVQKAVSWLSAKLDSSFVFACSRCCRRCYRKILFGGNGSFGFYHGPSSGSVDVAVAETCN